MWSMDYVQVPAEEDKQEEVEVSKVKKKENANEENKKETTKKRVHELVKQMSISNEGTGKWKIKFSVLILINRLKIYFIYFAQNIL